MSEFPKMVYYHPAKKSDAVEPGVGFVEIDNSGFLYFIVQNEDELAEAEKRGWCESFVDARNGGTEPSGPVPTEKTTTQFPKKPKRPAKPKNKISGL